jgi:hypothetical protein
VAKGRGDSRRLTTSERPTPVSWHASAMPVPSAIKWGARHGRRRRRGRPPTAGKKEGASAAVSVAGAEDAADRADTPANSPLSLGRRLRRPPSCVMSDVWSRSTTHAGWAWATSPCTGGHTDDRAPLDRHAVFFLLPRGRVFSKPLSHNACVPLSHLLRLLSRSLAVGVQGGVGHGVVRRVSGSWWRRFLWGRETKTDAALPKCGQRGRAANETRRPRGRQRSACAAQPSAQPSGGVGGLCEA